MLVVGAGKVALRKTRGLLEAGARVTVIAPEWESEFETLPVRLVPRRFRASDLGNAVLVFAATNDRLTNHRVGIAEARRGIDGHLRDACPAQVASHLTNPDQLAPLIASRLDPGRLGRREQRVALGCEESGARARKS